MGHPSHAFAFVAWRSVPDCVHNESVTSDVPGRSQASVAGLSHRHGVFRNSVHLDWISYCAIDVPAPHTGRTLGNRRNVLRDRLFRQLPGTVLRTASGPVHDARGAHWRRIIGPVASGERRERSTMEGASLVRP